MITTRLVIPSGSRLASTIPKYNKEANDLSPPLDDGMVIQEATPPATGKSITYIFLILVLRSVKDVTDAMQCTELNEKSEKGYGLSTTLLSQHDVIHSKPPPLEWIVVRIEVTDTGCGIRQKDMAQTKLFCECIASTV